MAARRLLPKVALLGMAAMAVVVLVGAPGLGQSALQPEGELSEAECYGHHKQEGFRSMDLYPTVLAQVPRNQEFPIELTIRNPWLHEVHDLFGYVDISGAPGLSFPGEREPTAVAQSGTLEPTPGDYTVVSFPIPVEVNATEIALFLSGDPGQDEPLTPIPLNPRNDFDLTLTSPNANVIQRGPDPRTGTPVAPPGETGDLGSPGTVNEEIHVDVLNVTLGGLGDWTATVEFRGLQPGAYELTGAVYYNLSKSTKVVVPAEPANIGPGEQAVIRFTVLAKESADIQAIRYGGIGKAFHDHTDGNIEDEGQYDKWNTFTAPMGDTLEVGALDIAVTKVDTLGPIFRRWGQVIGFASSFLILPSLVFGGTFGRATVQWSNKMLGTPRRRVLFHNSMSFWLLGLALLHLVMFLYESFWNWSHGLVWGGLALACMVGLGVTGATQRRFVAQWGFNRWRFVHFAMGILVVVFTLVHMTADGSHLAPIREWFGATE